NYTHFYNREVDRLYERSLNEPSDSLRQIYYQQMSRIITGEAPVIILYYDQVLRFVRKNISGLGINPTNLLTLKNVTIQ
ncbi:MAG TPA: hypothetical protein P5184_09670, partial [Bacteroidales bacterium]|nr:hypothetical protein [Bacteroidales bacterium]